MEWTAGKANISRFLQVQGEYNFNDKNARYN